MSEQFHAAVIGGGPAGSTAATLLARQGWEVVLFEREQFPRAHVGESLLPASLPILEDLGVLDAVRAEGFVEKRGATMVWGTSAEPWSWHFSETNKAYPTSFQVWRPTFDKLLLDNAAANGVDVRERHWVTDVALDGAVQTVTALGPGGPTSADVRFVVDASGQGGLLGRQLELREMDNYFRNLAVYGYFSGAGRLRAPDEGNIFIESYSDGWLWAIPLHTGQMSVGAVVDSETGQKGIRADGSEQFLRRQIERAPRLRDMLAEARLEGTPEVARDWSYTSKALAGEGWVLVGDAGCFVDPLFSSGVHLALLSAVYGAAHVTTALRRPGMARATGRTYEQLYFQQYGHFRELARLFYASNRSADSYFWEARRALEESERTPREAFINAVAGAPPVGYERVVIERGEAPGDWVEGVRAVEAGRVARRRAFEAAASGEQTQLREAIPVLAKGAEVVRAPVLGEGEFVDGFVLRTALRTEGTPISGLVALLVTLIDGRRSVGELLTALHEKAGETLAGQVGPIGVAALRILYVEGAVAELRGVGAAG